MLNENKRTAKTATETVVIFWKERFFTEWRSATQVAEEFSKTGYHFRSPALSKALSRASFITPKGKGKGLQYIQSYPYQK